MRLRKIYFNLTYKYYSATVFIICGNCCVIWAKSLQSCNPKFVSIDGKTVRGSHGRSSGLSAIHTASAWCSEQNVVLGQYKTAEKSNEITAIPELLELLSIKSAVISIDVMGCQRKISKNLTTL